MLAHVRDLKGVLGPGKGGYWRLDLDAGAYLSNENRSGYGRILPLATHGAENTRRSSF